MKYSKISTFLILLFTISMSFAQTQKWTYKWSANSNAKSIDLSSEEQFNQHNYLIAEFKQIPNAQKRTSLKSQGVELLGYIDNNHYWVRIASNQLSKISNFGISRVAVPTQDNKHNPYIEEVSLRTELKSYVMKLWSAVDVHQLAAFVEATYDMPTAVVSESRGLVEVQTSGNQLKTLASLPAVAYVGPLSRTAVPLISNSISMNRANYLQAETFGPGLSGDGINVGIWDGGISGGHIDLNGNVENIENTFIALNDSKHSTNVAGIIGGKGHRNVRIKGMAPESDIKIWTFDGDIINEMLDGVANESLSIINSSFLLDEYNDPLVQMCQNSGFYVLESSEMDKMVRDNNSLLHIVANGNNQSVCAPNPPRSGIPIGLQSAKNSLNVAWMDQFEVIVGGSNFGPTKDGRWKPEITAKGKVVTTTNINDGYDGTQGSSFAAPNVAGVAALLQEYYQDENGSLPDAALLRGLICNTADDMLTRNANGLKHFGPDFIYGFGSINGKRAYDVLANDQYFMDDVADAQTKTFQFTVSDDLEQVNVGLSWSDVEAMPGDLSPLVNDLNMTIQGPDSTYQPWVIFPRRWWKVARPGIDSINNIEQITIRDPQPGTYTITIVGEEVPFGPQEFAVNYSYFKKAAEMTHPVGGEQWFPGETQYIRFDAADVTVPYTLEISYDGGANYELISTSTTDRFFRLWTVPDTVAFDCKIRVSNGGFSHESGSFSIAPRVNQVFGDACDKHIKLNWDMVEDADEYDVMLLDLELDKYVVLDSTTDTSYIISNLNNGQDYWISVIAKYGNEKALRSNGYVFTPDGSDCNFTDDIGVSAFCGPLGFRYAFDGGLPYSGEFQIILKNYSVDDIVDFDVCYQREGELPICETINDTLFANQVDTFTFGTTETFADTLNYPVKFYTSFVGDLNNNNDSLDAQVKIVPSYPTPIPYAIDFENVEQQIHLEKYFALEDMREWDFNATSTDGRISIGRLDQFAFESMQALTLDRYTGSEVQTNEAILNLNLTGYQDSTVYLDFGYLDHGELENAGDKLWARADDSEPWIEVFDFGANRANFNYKFLEAVNLSEILIAQNGQTYGNNFQLKFGQEGDGAAVFVNENDGRSFDNIKLYNPGFDVSLEAVKAKGFYCALEAGSFPLTVTVSNNSTADLTNIEVAFTTNTGLNVTETIPSINAGQIIDYTFSTEVNYLPGQQILLNAYVNASSDRYAENDSILNTLILVQPYANASGYDDLEALSNTLALGQNSSWELGTPTNGIISEAASGNNAWATDLASYYNNYERSFVFTDCYDFSGYNENPNFAFNLKLNVETNFDRLSVQYSDDGGLTWKQFVTQPEAYNWNNGSGEYWDMNVLEWTPASNDLYLDSLTNPEAVLFRYYFFSDQQSPREGAGIDDIHVTEDVGEIALLTNGQSVVNEVTAASNFGYLNDADNVLLGVKGTNEQLNLGVKKESDPIVFQDRFILPTHFYAQGVGFYTYRLFLSYAEYQAFFGSIPTWAAPSQMGVMAYKGLNVDDELENNAVNYEYLVDEDLQIKPYRNGYILEFDYDGDAEFYIYSKILLDALTEVTTFTATANEDLSTTLDWTSTFEGSNNGFTIEVSFDGDNYSELTTVPGMGSATTGATYQIIDSISEDNCIKYYRLSNVYTVQQPEFIGIDTVNFEITYDPVFQTSCNPMDTGTVVQSLTSMSGCDSTVTVITTLLPSYSDTIYDTSCNPADTGMVVVNPMTVNGCDSTISTITTLLPAYNTTINETSCNPLDEGTTVDTFTASTGCDSIVTTITTLLESFAVELNATTCNPGDSGTTNVTLTASNGCDSVVTTTTTLLDAYQVTINEESCNPLDVGTAVDTLTASSGCDSIVTTITTLLESFEVELNATTCNPGDAGTTNVTLTASNGCDSVVTTTTTLLDAYQVTINEESCNPLDEGTAVDTLTASSGCDSIVTTITTLLESFAVELSAITCNPGDAGTTIETLTASNGCDSVVTTTTTLLDAYQVTINEESCNPLDEGTTVDTFTASTGCDSIVTTITTLLESFAVELSATTCNPGDAGTTIETLTASNGCDSVVTTNTTLLDAYEVTVNAESCNPLDEGTTVDTFTASTGCDSIVTTITTLLESFALELNATTCNPADVGMTIATLTASNGCDSVVTTTTTLLDAYQVTINEESCNPLDVGTAVDTFTASTGCDSIVTTITTLLESFAVELNATTCNPGDAGSTMETLTASNGCDSVVTTTTTLLDAYQVTINEESCNPLDVGTSVDTLTASSGCDSVVTTTTTLLASYDIELTNYTCDESQVGNEILTLTTMEGCDSIITINTVLSENLVVELFESTCDPEATGVVTQIFYNALGEGCDSTVITTTTLFPISTSTIELTTCNPSDAGVFVDTLAGASVNGCDSIVTSIVTLLMPSYATINATTCDVNAAGTSVDTLEGAAANGCDSIITTITTLLASDAVSINETTCVEADAGYFVDTFTNQNGCDSIVSKFVQFVPPPVADFSLNLDGLSITLQNNSTGDDSHVWNFGDGNSVNNSAVVNYEYAQGGQYTISLEVTNECGNDTKTETIDIVQTAIDLNAAIESIVVYPNPNSGQFALELKGQLKTRLNLQLFDVNGKTLDSRTIDFDGFARTEYSFENLPAGHYLLNIQSKEGSTTLKVNILN